MDVRGKLKTKSGAQWVIRKEVYSRVQIPGFKRLNKILAVFPLFTQVTLRIIACSYRCVGELIKIDCFADSIRMRHHTWLQFCRLANIALGHLEQTLIRKFFLHLLRNAQLAVIAVAFQGRVHVLDPAH